MYKLEVQDLHKRYGSHEVLKGVSLAAAAGDVISIIGSSGSGKSTFLRCINLLEQPHAGKILLNNEELKLVANKDGAMKAADPKQLQRMRSRLSMVFQHFNLWSHMTALENVMEAPVHVLGMSKKTRVKKPSTIWPKSAWAIARMRSRATCPAVSSSAWRLPVPWRWSLR